MEGEGERMSERVFKRTIIKLETRYYCDKCRSRMDIFSGWGCYACGMRFCDKCKAKCLIPINEKEEHPLYCSTCMELVGDMVKEHMKREAENIKLKEKIFEMSQKAWKNSKNRKTVRTGKRSNRNKGG